MTFSAFDEAAMRRALELAERGLFTTHPNPRVGAVLARDNEIVGEGWHERAGEPHAEPIAIRAAAIARAARRPTSRWNPVATMAARRPAWTCCWPRVCAAWFSPSAIRIRA